MSQRPVIAITMGDPAGIGPEIALKAALDPGVRERCRPVIIGSLAVLEAVNKSLGCGARLAAAEGAGGLGDAASDVPDRVDVLDLANCAPGEFEPGTVSARCGRAAYEYIERAIRLALAGEVKAVVTGPVHKVSLRAAGVPYPGHTEIFAALTNTREYAMMLVAGGLRVSHVTTHVALAEVPQRVRRARVLGVIRLTHDAVKRMGIPAPRIGVAGLNPHSGEGGLFGDEDEREIRPAVLDARSEGIAAEGPVPADTVFVKALAGQYDAVVAMYHDQGHIPVKLSGFKVDQASGAWTAVTGVNVTLGLPIVRTSVDHGVAFDIAGKGIARPESMIEAVHLAADMSASH